MNYYTSTDTKFEKLTARSLRQAKAQATKAQAWAHTDAVVYQCEEDGIATVVAIKHSAKNARWEKESSWIGQLEYNSFFDAIETMNKNYKGLKND